jgi:hypothetical protein
MRRFLFLAVALLAAAQLLAAPVNVTVARETAQRFMLERNYSGILRAPISGQLTLAYTEMNSQMVDRAAFYVFNTNNGFIIVSGDDRAEPILGYGDQPFDINRIPCNMRAWLGTYKEQLEYLQAHEGMQVQTPSMMAPSLRTPSVAPLLTAMWDQESPYWNQCKFNGTQCLTGCPATSAAMVFYYWKYPDYPTDPVPAYRFSMSSGWSSTTVNVPELPSVTFDWDHMKDKYTSGYTTEEATAVATLMRYVGQAEHMEYGSDGSGIDADSVILIVNAFKLLGYDEETVRMVKKTSAYSGGSTIYTDAEWAAIMQEELAEERPIVFCAVSGGWFGGGHAFNVDGYDASTNKYHINWGWSGDYNNYFAINAFSGGGSTYNQYQQMVIGIQPPSKTPRLRVSDRSLSMECFKGQTASASFTLRGSNLEDDATLTLNDPEGVFTLDETTLPMEGAKEGKLFTVTYTPKAARTYNATITCSTPNGEDVTVDLTGNSPYELYRPEMLPVDASTVTATSFRADWTDNTPLENVVSYTLEVKPKADVMLLTEADWSDVPQESTNHASDAQNYLPEDWTFSGNFLYLDGGFISSGRNCVLTAHCDMSSYDKVSVIVKAKAYPKGTNTTLDISTSESSRSLILARDVQTYLVVLDCNGDTEVNFTTGYYPEIQSIKIYGGEIEDAEPYALHAPAMRGDDGTVLIEGISPELTTYNVTGLTPGQTYFYHLKAIYVNDTESAWSRFQEVILPMQSLVIGDVDGDGVVGIADVAALIDYILNGGVAGINEQAADVDQNGEINIADASELIDYLLNGDR